MATELDVYLAGLSPKGFNAVAHYFGDGDYATYFTSNERCYEERVDDRVTVYLSMQTKRLVGIKVKGVKKILEGMGGRDFIVNVTRRPVTISLLLVGAGIVEPASREKYALLGKQHFLEVPIKNDAALATAA